MGCVCSKYVKKQAAIDQWTSAPITTRTPPTKRPTMNNSVECYHAHFVSLTSSSYGLMKVAESPKLLAVEQSHQRATIGSLSEMYGKLRRLEMGEPAQIKPVGELTDMPHALVPNQPQRSPLHLSPAHHCCFDSTDFVISETIEVSDMMMGLEGAAPLQEASSPVNQASTATSKPKPLSSKQKRRYQRAEDIIHNSFNGGLVDDDEDFGKENSCPINSQDAVSSFKKQTALANRIGKSPFSGNKSVSKSMVPGRSRTPPSPLCQPPLKRAASTTRYRNNIPSPLPQVTQPRMESIVTRKLHSERCSLSRESQMKDSVASSSTSSISRSMKYTPSGNGKVKLSLHAHHYLNDTAASLAPSSIPSRSMSRRLGVGGSLASTEPNSPLFDPDLVASYEEVLCSASEGDWNTGSCLYTGHQDHEMSDGTCTGDNMFWSSKVIPVAALDKRLYDPFTCFQVKCPPGGENGVVLYTTTLRGIRKTFEDCNTAREILESCGLIIDERDVSMHLEFLNELRQLMDRVVSVPRLFIKGRYIGGIEEVVNLHENGKLSELVEGLPKEVNRGTCDGCGGIRFVPCLECRGSCKVRSEGDNRVIRCPDCNENGLIQCPICT